MPRKLAIWGAWKFYRIGTINNTLVVALAGHAHAASSSGNFLYLVGCIQRYSDSLYYNRTSLLTGP